MLSSSVVTNPRVPRLVRHSLNLESGLYDGLALPAVLAFSAALAAGQDEFVWWKFVLQDVGLGLVFGLVLGLAADAAGRKLTDNIPVHAQSLYALGAAFAIYGIAVGLPPEGNGFIAVFVGAIVLGIQRPDLRVSFENRADDIVEIIKLGVFVVFGSLLSIDQLFADGWAAVGVVVFTLLVAGVVRPKGGGDHDLLVAGAGRADCRRRADLQPRGALRLRLGPRARTQRHSGVGVVDQARG